MSAVAPHPRFNRGSTSSETSGLEILSHDASRHHHHQHHHRDQDCRRSGIAETCRIDSHFFASLWLAIPLPLGRNPVLLPTSRQLFLRAVVRRGNDARFRNWNDNCNATTDEEGWEGSYNHLQCVLKQSFVEMLLLLKSPRHQERVQVHNNITNNKLLLLYSNLLV